MFLAEKPAEKYVMSLPLDGVLLKKEEILKNTKIIREVSWGQDEDEHVRQEFVTDGNGVFSLPLYEVMYSRVGVAHFMATTEISIEYKNELITLWTSTKTRKELNGSFDPLPKNITCDITNEKMYLDLPYDMCVTKCRWDTMPEEQTPETA